MNDFNVLKHKVEDLGALVEQVASSVTKSKCLVSEGGGESVAVSAGVSVSGGGLHYECMVLDGQVQDITIYLNDNQIANGKGRVLVGDLPMKNRYIYAVKVVAKGVECKNMVLHLTGAGLKVI